MASVSKTRRTHPSNTGIICAGYLLKERDGMVRAGWAERYVVLSSDYLHYFRRTDSKSEMFGEERDKIPVGTVERVLVKVISLFWSCLCLQGLHFVLLFLCCMKVGLGVGLGLGQVRVGFLSSSSLSCLRCSCH